MPRILHPTDFSPASRAAFFTAVKLARKDRAELVIMHVLARCPVLTVRGGRRGARAGVPVMVVR